MSTFYTVLDEQFSGSSLNTYWLQSYGSGTVTVGSGSCSLETVANTASTAGIYMGASATDGTPLRAQTSNSQVITEAAMVPNGVWNGTSGGYQCGLGVSNNADTEFFVIESYARTTSQYTITVSTPNGTSSDIVSFNNGTKFYFRIWVDETGVVSPEYSTDGDTWTAIDTSYSFSTNSTLYPYVFYRFYDGGGGLSGSSATCDVDYLTFKTTDPPRVSFTADIVSGVSPLTVNFTDTSPGTFTAWNWDFGDGNTSTDQNPSHTYTTAGVYEVFLMATDYVGTNTITKTNLINVGPGITGVSNLTGITKIGFS